MIVTEGLRWKWDNFWTRNNAVGEPSESFTEILNHYSEANRHYHTLDHLEACLLEFDNSMCIKPKTLMPLRELFGCMT